MNPQVQSGKIWPVILSGGAGSRLWPLSRGAMPKQLWPLLSDLSLLQDTVRRVADPATYAAPLIVTNEDHRFLVAEQMRQAGVDPAAILLEPAGRNTAPAAALAALFALQSDPDALLLILPSDHAIADNDALQAAIAAAAGQAASGHLACFGILPRTPETGYGYIERGAPVAGGFTVAQFVEKPDRATAETYLASGRYYWNSGMFLFPAKLYLDELNHHDAAMVECCRAAMAEAKADGVFLRPSKAFLDCPSNSIDYAVMEKTTHATVVPTDIGWSDVGSWAALWDVSAKDGNENVVKGDVIALNTHGSLLRSLGPKIAAIGVRDLVVVTTKDAVLVLHRDHAQDVKSVVESLARDGDSAHIFHTEVHRPWGSYETADAGLRYQVKRLRVKPGAQLSLQMHHHRSEHWIVVQGTAKVTCNDEIFLLQENQSTYIPAGSNHRLENPGKVELLMVEVQSGPYLGEDDIVRFDDQYGRI